LDFGRAGSRFSKGEKAMKKAMFGAGCFWGVEETFRNLEGVTNTAVGYAGGTLENPTYKDVCTDRTGHAEVVEVEHDPAKISYEQLLDTFWSNHDPTTLNRQGPDFGSQYRSAIFYYDDSQREAAEASKERLNSSGRFRRPIVTEIVAAPTFYRAEEYHQRYLQKRGQSHCSTH
jgi:peptide-methionine (S)-S-oxide reductase